jgi:protein-S-isoprenylcysteine O-methyltransferase Ste14
MPFRYLRDPLFLTALVLYLGNRFLVKPLVSGGFFHNHFNDLLCVPLFVPIVVFVAHLCRARPHEGAPEWYEILLPLLVWSIQFELIYPQLPFWSRWVTGDPQDILWYCVGAAISSLWWWFYYQRRLATQAAG